MAFYSLILENKIAIPNISPPLTHSGKHHHQQLNISLQKVREASLRLHSDKMLLQKEQHFLFTCSFSVVLQNTILKENN
jgi:hypothetical protein